MWNECCKKTEEFFKTKCGRHILKKVVLLILIIVFLIIVFLCDKYLCSAKQETVCVNDCYENIIAITFDDGPNKSTTTVLLDGLKERGVKATFFLVGNKAEQNTELVKRMYEEGHLIGNHTYTHVQLCNVSDSESYEEIVKTNEIIEQITGEAVQYIRPPYGSYSNKLLMRINMTPVMWSIDPEDWNTKDVNKVVKSVVENVKGGDIILLHDIYDTSVAAALEIIDELKARGFVFVTVDQLLLD
jgi:peptidoglycan/xylan/chitin deacetylase (PgdA/CDA1 family)